MKSKGRYEIREILGEGAMGIVYRAYDPITNREVTVKTVRDAQDKAVLELFRRECAVLASMTHPNIVEIFDIGETEDDGQRRPYFVMPLLPGVTLQELIKTSSSRLTVERSVQMISQICRGLSAAHEHGLVHRDLKPSNLFILPDDSVKIIDFGMAHLTNHRSVTGLKGTPLYMAPEQIQHRQQPTPYSDQFSLGVVCYEMLARRHPFVGSGQEDLVQAILKYQPPPVSEFNPVVAPLISQVIHKALAKEPYNRFPDVRSFSECLQKALRGESLDIFDPARIAPRLQKARTAFESGDLVHAAELIGELESENYLAPEIRDLSRQIEETQRTKAVSLLLETARRRVEEGDYVRALQKVQEVLNLDSTNTDAHTLRGSIESKRSSTQIDEWFRLATQHLENHAYGHARQALEKVLDLRPKEHRAQALLVEVDRREHEYNRLRAEKQQAYQSAVDAFQRGDVNSALHKLERVLDLDRRLPDGTSPEQGARYQRLYEEVRSKRDQLASQEGEARRHLDSGNYPAAAQVCAAVLAVYPGNVLFQVLRDDVEQAQRLEISAFVAKIEREIAAEPDLNRRVSILEEASRKYPSEQRFAQFLQSVRARRDLVDSIVGRARAFEESRQFSDALGQWETLLNIHPQYPGLAIEIDRLRKRREQQRQADAKAQWISQIDQALAVHNYSRAGSLMAEAAMEFPADTELATLASQIQHAQIRAADIEDLTNHGRQLYAAGSTEEAIEIFRQACHLDAQNPIGRTALVEALTGEASRYIDSDWRRSDVLVREAIDLDPSNPLARSLATLVQDKCQVEEVSAVLSAGRELQAQGRIRDAITEVDKARDIYPQERRLVQFRAVLLDGLSAGDRQAMRAHDLESLNQLAEQSKITNDVHALDSIFQKSTAFSKYATDAEFLGPLSAIEERVRREHDTARGPSAYLAAPDMDGWDRTQIVEPGGWPAVSQPPPLHEVQRAPGKPVRNLKPIAIPLGIGFGVVASIILASLTYDWFARRNEAASAWPATSVRVSVRNLSRGEYRILDQSGKDVTENAAGGLGQGQYKLVATKHAFVPIDLPFIIDPSSGVEKVLETKWQASPADVNVRLSPTAGKVQIDGVDAAFDTSSSAKTRWTNGTHRIRWSVSANDFVEAEFEVKDIFVTIRDVKYSGAALAMIAVLNQSEIMYRTNIGGGIEKLADGRVESLFATDGAFAAPSTPALTFNIKFGKYPLGEFRLQTTGQPMVYASFVLPPKGPAKGVKPPPDPVVGGEPVPRPLPEGGLSEAEKKDLEETNAKRRTRGLSPLPPKPKDQ